MCFMLHDFVATLISFGCSPSPLQFPCSVHASTVATLPSIVAYPAFQYTCYMLVPMYNIFLFPYLLFICMYIRSTAEAEGEVRRL